MSFVILHGAKKYLCHSARSEAELQNLLNNRQNIFSSEPRRFCDCAQNDMGFLGRMTVVFSVDALRLSTLQLNRKVCKYCRADKRSASTAELIILNKAEKICRIK